MVIWSHSVSQIAYAKLISTTQVRWLARLSKRYKKVSSTREHSDQRRRWYGTFCTSSQCILGDSVLYSREVKAGWYCPPELRQALLSTNKLIEQLELHLDKIPDDVHFSLDDLVRSLFTMAQLKFAVGFHYPASFLNPNYDMFTSPMHHSPLHDVPLFSLCERISRGVCGPNQVQSTRLLSVK